jgi:hypothetical protein
MNHAKGEGRDQGERAGAHSLSVIQWGFPLYDAFNRPNYRGMAWAEWSRERLISVCRHLVDPLRL